MSNDAKINKQLPGKDVIQDHARKSWPKDDAKGGAVNPLLISQKNPKWHLKSIQLNSRTSKKLKVVIQPKPKVEKGLLQRDSSCLKE